MEKVSLLTDQERTQLPLVISRRLKFKNIVRLSIQNYNNTLSNSIMLVGKPGTGKTYLVTETLDQMLVDGEIAGYKRVPGHVSMSACYSIMEECSEPKDGKPKVVLFDDTDVLNDEPTLEILKAGFDSKNNQATNRKIYYFNKKKGREGITFNGFGIIITNDDFTTKKLNIHQQALLDRTQLMSIDLKPEDSFIYNTHLVEKMLNSNDAGYNDAEIESVVKMFNTSFRKWYEHDAFRKAQINFSTRLVKKFVDLQRMFGSDWIDYSMFYKKLEAACLLSDVEEGLINQPAEIIKKKSNVKVIKHRELPKQNRKGLFIDPKTNKPYSASMQCYYKKIKAQSVA